MNKKVLKLILSMLKIGLFTFGGGYAMVSIYQSEFVDKKKWLEKDEFYNMLTISESTPGPIAINLATYIGYKVGGIWVAVLSTISVVLPPFVIIYVISLFFDRFVAIEYVSYAFAGIKVAVAYVIIQAGLKMIKDLKLNAYNVIAVTVVLTAFILLNFFSVSFSSIFYIIMAFIAGIISYFISSPKKAKMLDEREDE